MKKKATKTGAMGVEIMTLPALAAALGLFLSLTPGFAQEGHPAKGSWIGEWSGNEVHGDFVLLVMDWDGERITGMINPGTDNIPISDASLDPSDWSLRIEASAQVEGQAVDYVIEGVIQDLELPSRSIAGTWRHQTGGGEFDIVRQ